MSVITALVSFLNIGLFSAVVSRFTAANMPILIFCSLLYMGTTPTETVAMMMTYLVFIRMTISTQRQRISFKKMQIFHGWRLSLPSVLIISGLFFYPFAALSVFLLVFVTEVLAAIRNSIPENHRMTAKELCPYIAIGSVITTISMIAVAYIPEYLYYAAGGTVIFLLCAFFWWIGNDRTRLTDSWEKVILLSFIPAGLFGFDLSDWLDDMRRYFVRSNLPYNLPLLFLPVFFIGFIMGHMLFGAFSLSGMAVAFFATLGLRLFGYYQMSGKGKFNLVALVITALAACLLFLTAPTPTGISSYIDQFEPLASYRFEGLLNL